MSLFKSIYKNTDISSEEENSKLIYLLSLWAKNQSDGNYTAIANELIHGNSFLYLPSVNDKEKNEIVQADKIILKLTSVFEID